MLKFTSTEGPVTKIGIKITGNKKFWNTTFLLIIASGAYLILKIYGKALIGGQCLTKSGTFAQSKNNYT